MDLTNFFNAQPGVYVVQAFLHSLSAAVIADRAVIAWDIRNPVIRQKFHLIAVFGPAFSYPLYQWLNPERGSMEFRLGTLFDSSRWIHLELWNVLSVGLLLMLLLVATTAVFLLQELIPILRHRPGPVDPGSRMSRAAPGSAVALAAEGLGGATPTIYVVDDEEPAIHSVTSRSPAIYLTTGLLRSLEPAELRVAIAHEAAHIRRGRRPLLIVAYVMRVALFFSAGTLVAFRRAAAEEEKICDDSAVRVTGRPDALAAVLEKLRLHDAREFEHGEAEPGLRSLAHVSYDLMVRERIGRLVDEASPAAAPGEWWKFAVTVASIAVLNYYVV
jgi:Zn-dependent protease with chaperone function